MLQNKGGLPTDSCAEAKILLSGTNLGWSDAKWPKNDYVPLADGARSGAE